MMIIHVLSNGVELSTLNDHVVKYSENAAIYDDLYKSISKNRDQETRYNANIKRGDRID